MVDFSAPAHPQSTRTTPASTDAGMTLSDILADHTAPAGGALQNTHSTAPLHLDQQDNAHYPLLFINHSLPYRRIKQTSWLRKNGDISVLFTAPEKFNAHGDVEPGLIPYGRIAREVLMYLVSSAIEATSRTIVISRTWRGFLRDIGIPYSSDNRAMVQMQLRALLDLSLSIYHPGTLAGRNFSTEKFMIGSGEEFTFDQDGLLDDSYRSVVILSQEFYDRITAELSPVEGSVKVLIDCWRDVTRKYPRSPMVSDVYLWLACRFPRLHGDGTGLSWRTLHEQFGSVISERDFRKTFRQALRLAAEEYFAPLGEGFDVHTYISEYGVGSRTGGGGIRLSPVSPAHKKLLSWDKRRRSRSQRPEMALSAPGAPVVDTSAEIVPIPAHAGVDITELRASLASAGLPTGTVSDGALRAAIDTVLSRATSVGNAQALVATAIVREPALLTGTASPVAPAQSPAVSAAPSQGAAPLISGRPVLPVAPCPVHGQDVTGLVCRDCAVELKSADTDSALAESCWRAVRARLTELSRLDGVDTSGEWVRYSSLAAAHGVEA